MKYLTALSSNKIWNELKTYQKVEVGKVYNVNGNVTMYHNVKHGFRKEFLNADCLYTDIPWPAGMIKFEKKANSSHMKYEDFLNKIINLVDVLKIPSIITAAPSLTTKMIQLGFKVKSITMTPINKKAVAYSKFIDIQKTSIETTEGLIRLLATRFYKILDPCCGTGQTGEIFKEHGKQFIMSDINRNAITYIRENIC